MTDTIEKPQTTLEFKDNRILTDLYGPNSDNLRKIEKEFLVSISDRGNKLHIKGTDLSRAQATRTLKFLETHIHCGFAVDPSDLRAAMDYAANPGRDLPKYLSGMLEEIPLPPSPEEKAKQEEIDAEKKRQEDKSEPKKAGQKDPEPKEQGTKNPELKEPELKKKDPSIIQVKGPRKQIFPKSDAQERMIEAMKASPLTFAIGPAGTGKTYLAVAYAVQLLTTGSVERIILSRPVVEAGERLGFLPGDMREKIDPYMQPLYDALRDMLYADKLARHIDNGTIEIAPLAYMRGRTLSNAFIILDEAQNTTEAQMKMALTRIGEGTKMVVCGDITQNDLPPRGRSGLIDALDTLTDVKDMSVIRYTAKDVRRSGLVAKIVEAYEKKDHTSKNNPQS